MFNCFQDLDNSYCIEVKDTGYCRAKHLGATFVESCQVDNLYELLHYCVKIIFDSVLMYFYVFFRLFYKCVSVIEKSVVLYFEVFENVFINCLETPQIYFITVMVFMVLFTFYLVFRTLWLWKI